MADYETHILARLSDFFTPFSPWQRRLWNWGTIPSLHELHGSPDWVEARVLSQGALTWLARDLEKVCGADPALGSPDLRRHLQQVLRSKLQCGSNDQRRLGQLIELAEDGYLSRWREVCTGARLPSAERVARAIASHLLAAGFSEAALADWVEGLAASAPDVGSILDSAIELINRTPTVFEVVVPFIAVPEQENRECSRAWLAAPELRSWMRTNGFANPRQNGGFKYEIQALDAYAAAAQVAGIVERMVARATYTPPAGGPPRSLGKVWIAGLPEPLGLEPPPRGAYVRSIQRERHLYQVETDTPLDIALELASPLNGAAAGPAISGAWAAIEMLLLNEKDDTQEGRGTIAADRLARLVTASWPRAELTALSYRHHPQAVDPLAARLNTTAPNRERALLVATAIKAGSQLALGKPSDVAAEARMARLTGDPRRQTRDVFELVRAAIRRFYRHRNILLHGGGIRVDSMESTLRTAAPLIGAGLDRIAHAYLTSNTSAIDLAAKAEVRLSMIDDIKALVTILE